VTFCEFQLNLSEGKSEKKEKKKETRRWKKRIPFCDPLLSAAFSSEEV